MEPRRVLRRKLVACCLGCLTLFATLPASAQGDGFGELLQAVEPGLDTSQVDLNTTEGVPGDATSYSGDRATDAIELLESTVVLLDSDTDVRDLWLASDPGPMGVVDHPNGFWIASGNTVPPSGELRDFVLVGARVAENLLESDFADIGVYISTPDGIPFVSPFTVDPNDGTDRSYNMFFAGDRMVVQGWQNIDQEIVPNNDDQGFVIGRADRIFAAVPAQAAPPGSIVNVWISTGTGLDMVQAPSTATTVSPGGSDASGEVEEPAAPATPPPPDPEPTSPAVENEVGDVEPAADDDGRRGDDATSSGDQDQTAQSEESGARPGDSDGGSDLLLILAGVIGALVVFAGGLFAWSRRGEENECEEEWRNWQDALTRTVDLERQRSEAIRRRDEAAARAETFGSTTTRRRSTQSRIEAEQARDAAGQDLDTVNAQLDRERANAAEWKRRYDICSGVEVETPAPDTAPVASTVAASVPDSRGGLVGGESDTGPGTLAPTGTGASPGGSGPEPDDGDDPRDAVEGGGCRPGDPAPKPVPASDRFEHASLTIGLHVTSREAGYRNSSEAARLGAELDELAGRLDTAGNLTPRMGYGLAVKIGLEILEGTAETTAELSRAVERLLESHEVTMVEMRTVQVEVDMQWFKIWVCRDGAWMCEYRLQVTTMKPATGRWFTEAFEGRPDRARERMEALLHHYAPQAEDGRRRLEAFLRHRTEGPCPCG